MRRALGMACAGLALTGCASHGVLPERTQVMDTQHLPDAFVSYVADEAAQVIEQTVLPAKQPLVLARPLRSALGQTLVATLRRRGFSIEESLSVADARARVAAQSAPGEYSRGLFGVEPKTLDVHEGAVAADLFYVRVDVGTTVLARSWVLTTKGTAPAGAWARQERGQ